MGPVLVCKRSTLHKRFRMRVVAQRFEAEIETDAQRRKESLIVSYTRLQKYAQWYCATKSCGLKALLVWSGRG